mmetsp:Transcript_45839/g.132748  ORF Transcript_45839/g.132748 Transcript_45839/m.132748 type:complete len:411 (+) Transcript_45839:344-1576(+)
MCLAAASAESLARTPNSRAAAQSSRMAPAPWTAARLSGRVLSSACRRLAFCSTAFDRKPSTMSFDCLSSSASSGTPNSTASWTTWRTFWARTTSAGPSLSVAASWKLWASFASLRTYLARSFKASAFSCRTTVCFDCVLSNSSRFTASVVFTDRAFSSASGTPAALRAKTSKAQRQLACTPLRKVFCALSSSSWPGGRPKFATKCMKSLLSLSVGSHGCTTSLTKVLKPSASPTVSSPRTVPAKTRSQSSSPLAWIESNLLHLTSSSSSKPSFRSTTAKHLLDTMTVGCLSPPVSSAVEMASSSCCFLSLKLSTPSRRSLSVCRKSGVSLSSSAASPPADCRLPIRRSSCRELRKTALRTLPQGILTMGFTLRCAGIELDIEPCCSSASAPPLAWLSSPAAPVTGGGLNQ